MNQEPIKVLLIDDDEDDYILTCELFSLVKAGTYDLSWASSYEEGLRIAALRNHHVCLVDYRLGERNGVDLIRSARESRLTTPMILLTGQGDHDIDVEAMEAGATDYLVKDETSPTRLERTIRYAVQINTERCLAEAQLEGRLRKQAVLTEIGRIALAGGDLQELFGAAVTLVGSTLNVKYSKVLEIDASGETFTVRAATGWNDASPVGEIISASEQYQPGFRLHSNAPLTVEDLRTETRFSGPPLLHEQGVVSGMSAVVRGRKAPYGILGAHTEQLRQFDTDELDFMVSVANVLAEAIMRKREDDEDVVRVLNLNADLAERKRVEEALRVSEERFHLVTRATKDVVWDWDLLTNGLWWNESFQTTFGYDAEEVGTNIESWTERLHPDDQDRIGSEIHRAIDTGEHSWSGEYRFLRADGTYALVADRGYVVHDETGKAVRMIGSMMDVSERNRAAAALEEAAKRESAMIANALDVICTIDGEGRFISVSPACLKIWGYRPDELIGRRFIEFVSADDVERTTREDAKVLAGTVTTNFENRYVHKNGSLVPVVWTSYWSDLEQLVFAVARDNTERKLLEEELRKAHDTAVESVRLKSEFLANMSHEIRTPMNGVIGMTGLLLETDLSFRQREYTDTIQTSANALLTIIDDILDFSKIEAGLLRFETIDFDLRTTVESAVELLADRAQTKGLEVASLVYQGVPTLLRGDPGRLRQVLTNLMGNSVKFTERGEVIVSVTKVSDDDTGAMLRFEIQDTGIGISAEAQLRLFQAFTQADGSTTRKYGGTGLGLAISKQLVSLMDGEIGINSTPGQGSTFWFTAKFEKQPVSSTALTQGDRRLLGIRGLIVDDNATNRRIVKHQTGSWGMISEEADSGKRALELLRAGAAAGTPYDVAVLDLWMPDMDGFQLSEAIKADPAIAAVVLVLLPSFGRRGHGERATQAGIAAYLPKPVRQSQLQLCLTTVLSASTRGEEFTSAPLVTRHSLRESEARFANTNISSVYILVAEDNPVNQMVALGQLGNLGYRATAVANGIELLKALEHEQADIILMDCQMPEMDGFAATAEIRRREGEKRHTTIIAMTANAFDGDREKCIAAGMDDYLSKPVDLDVLGLKLAGWTRARREVTILDGPGEAVTEAPEGGVVDQAQLTNLRKIKDPAVPDFLTMLIDIYLNQVPPALQTLREAVTKRDTLEIKRGAHFLKGSSANIGATKMATLSLALERENEDRDVGELLARLEYEFEMVGTALNAERKEF